MKNKLIVGIYCHQKTIENMVKGMVYYIFNKRSFSKYDDFLTNRHEYKLKAINNTISYDGVLRNMICAIFGLHKSVYETNLSIDSFYSPRENIFYKSLEFITPEHKIFTKEDDYKSLFKCEFIPVIRLKDFEKMMHVHFMNCFGNTYNITAVSNLALENIQYNDIVIISNVNDMFKAMSVKKSARENIISLNIEIGKSNDEFINNLMDLTITYNDGNYMAMFYSIYQLISKKLCYL